MNLRQFLRKQKLFRFLTSVKLTVVLLSLLFILTFWGTVAQVYNGLYLAQQRYFESFYFLAMGFFPFPGGQLVMWGLFTNLVSVAFLRLAYRWRNSGIVIIHYGLLLFLFSGFVTLFSTHETYLSLQEGHASNVSSAYYNWEISVWEKSSSGSASNIDREVTAVSANKLNQGQVIDLSELGFQMTVKEFHKNCGAYQENADRGNNPLNGSGIHVLKPLPLDKQPEKNDPGVILTVQPAKGEKMDILLFGNELQPTSFKAGDKEYTMALRLARQPLPFTLKLDDFVMEKHPGTETARSFKSLVSIETQGAWRNKTISMNNPLRYRDFTIYQASYAIDQMGRETSTLAVVKNAGRVLPYVSTFVTFAGLALHFILMAFSSKKEMESPYVSNGQ